MQYKISPPFERILKGWRSKCRINSESTTDSMNLFGVFFDIPDERSSEVYCSGQEMQLTSPHQLDSMDSRTTQCPLRSTRHPDQLYPLIDPCSSQSSQLKPPVTHHCWVYFAVDFDCFVDSMVSVTDGDTLGLEVHQCLPNDQA